MSGWEEPWPPGWPFPGQAEAPPRAVPDPCPLPSRRSAPAAAGCEEQPVPDQGPVRPAHAAAPEQRLPAALPPAPVRAQPRAAADRVSAQLMGAGLCQRAGPGPAGLAGPGELGVLKGLPGPSLSSASHLLSLRTLSAPQPLALGFPYQSTGLGDSRSVYEVVGSRNTFSQQSEWS